MSLRACRAVACALLLAWACAACTPMRSTIKPPYTIAGHTFDETGLQQYAAAACKDSEGHAQHPPFAFTTDGCSLWPDGGWRECCVVHDVSYWCGGPSARIEADHNLRACVAEHSSSANAFFMYAGVRLGGARWLPFPWRWGYGYRWPGVPVR